MKEKQAIITLNYIINNDELYSLLRQICVASIRDYAKRMDIDFILMNNVNSRYDRTSNQLQCLEYLDYYDKIMYLDGDCYVPKLFNVNILDYVDEHEIGMQEAQKPYDYDDRYDCYIKYLFVILVVNKYTREFLIDYKYKHYTILNQYEEIYLNKILQSITNKLQVHDLPFLRTYYFIPKRHDTICHLWCNKTEMYRYKEFLINSLKKVILKNKNQSIS